MHWVDFVASKAGLLYSNMTDKHTEMGEVRHTVGVAFKGGDAAW